MVAVNIKGKGGVSWREEGRKELKTTRTGQSIKTESRLIVVGWG